MSSLLYNLPDHIYFFAQQIKDPDIIGQITTAWQNFVESGQVWAMLIGMFFGYVFASFTKF